MIESFQGRFRFLSNFWICKVQFEGQEFTSSEAAYQAAKTCDLEKKKAFSTVAPGQAKRKGRELTIRADWNEVRIGVMRAILVDKFTRNLDLRELLLQTDTHELIEGNYWGDTFWGVDVKKGGQNHLGKLLMCVRGELMQDINSY